MFRRFRENRASDRRGTWLVMVSLAMCGTIMSLQQTIVVPLLPDLPLLLDTSPESASWLVTASLLTGAVSTPVVTRLADMYGKRRLMLACLGLVALGSAVGGLSDSLALSITARGLQGFGLALVPVGIAMMRDELPPEKVPLGVALMSATLAIGAGAGLPLAGVIVAHLDWHAVFWVSGAAAVVMLVVLPLVVRPSPAGPGGSFDYRGAVVLTVGLALLLLAVSKGGQWGWTSPATAGCLLGGLALVLGLVPLELRTRNPLIDVRIATIPPVLLVNVGAVLLGFAMFANLLVTTQLLQLPLQSGFGLGLDTTSSGIWMAPSALVFGVMAPVAARITNRFGAETTLLAGSLGMGLAYVGRVFLSHRLWEIVVGSMLVALGTSLTFAAMPILLMRAVPETETASANGLNTLLRSVGTSSSSAAVATILALGMQTIDGVGYPTFDSLAEVFWIAAGTSILAALLTIPLFTAVANPGRGRPRAANDGYSDR